jgi:hypothetical protein
MNAGKIPKHILCSQQRGQISIEHPMKRGEENMRP